MKIVILPGLDGTGILLSEIEELLAPKHVVVSLQYPTNLCRYEDLQTWVEERLPKGDFIIVAESFSGPLAVMLASKRIASLRGVVFVATFVKAPRSLPSILTYAIEYMPVKSRLLTWLAQPILMGKWSKTGFTAKFRQAMNLVPTSTIAGRLREVLKVDVVEKLGRLDTPFIYLQATHDRLVPAKMSHDFQVSPDTVVAIEGPHFLLQASFLQSAKQISDFAARCS
ncbi:alpha/beta fold hydrolase [Parasedimentitalea maritima]|uniref:Alpha/beta hydrolase n=1 Tax=Parasedimentitalea maritima TaxID=2578117 RepID=A0A6A4RLC8_9RHOB|nr:alpha/beta hydrolase [Zongyanglinia marina]KAE9630526.1 alpha/beta hydrolase [Zongyanglinia marina]